MSRVAMVVLIVLGIMFVVPFPFYAGFSAAGWVEMPEPDASGAFMLGVLVTKLGVAITFVVVLRWLLRSDAVTWQGYAFAWLVFFSLGEIGQAMGPGYGWGEALAGMLSEAAYVPLSAFAAYRMLVKREEQSRT